MDAAGVGVVDEQLLPWPVLSGDEGAGDDAEHASLSSDECKGLEAHLDVISREGAAWAESAAEVRALELVPAAASSRRARSPQPSEAACSARAPRPRSRPPQRTGPSYHELVQIRCSVCGITRSRLVSMRSASSRRRETRSPGTASWT